MKTEAVSPARAFAVLAGILAASAWTPTNANTSGPGASANTAVAAVRISAEDFGALPFLSNPKLSPGGGRVLATTYVRGAKRLTVLEIGAKTAIAQSLALPEKHDLVWYRWLSDDRILMSLGSAVPYFGDKAYSTRLMMFDLNTRKPSFIGRRGEGLDGDDVIYYDPNGKWLLLSMQKSIYDYPSVFRVDLDTLDIKQIVKSRPYVWDWFADGSGVVRAGLGVQGRRWWLLYRKDEKSSFEKVVRRVARQEEEGEIERFILMDGSDRGYAVSNARTGRYALYSYDFTADAIGEPVYEHPDVDIDDFYLSNAGKIEAIYYTDDRPRIEWLNPKMKTVQGDIDKALPDRINRVTSISRDASAMLVWTGAAADPGAYYYYRVDAGVLSLLARPYDKITGKTLARVESTSYQARDGLKIPAYLTTPPSMPTPQAAPLVVLPHGGPFARDEWGYDIWAQFLASRGYVVLQPNFRGSTGYGKAFVEKGFGQWGRAMQDDLDDGVKWLVDQGKVDAKRVCIMGASYGGYAAMWAAARNPGIYRCAISFAGISDLGAMIRYDRRLFAAPRYYRNWREKVQGDEEFNLKTVSPLYAVGDIGAPLLIAHGADDDNVPASQSRKLAEALQKAGKRHSLVIYDGEGHSFDDPANAVDFLTRVETFLDEHNPAQ